MYSILFLALLRLIMFVAGGYVLFRFTPLQEKHLNFIIFLTLNILLPVYFVRNFIIGWDNASDIGFVFMFAFFVGSIFFLLFQIGIARLISPLVTAGGKYRREFILLFAFQNAGYVALPIMESFAPPSLMIFMFFWIFGFSSFFWIFSIPLIEGVRGKAGFRLNGPLIGILTGILVSVSGLNEMILPFAEKYLALPAAFGLNLILLSLGGVLATIPKNSFKIRKDYLFLLFFKLLLYPLSILLILIPLQPDWIPSPLLVPMKLALVLQAAVPPSTNLMIATKRYGTASQIAYIAGGEIITYPASVITMPIVLSISFFVLM